MGNWRGLLFIVVWFAACKTLRSEQLELELQKKLISISFTKKIVTAKQAGKKFEWLSSLEDRTSAADLHLNALK